MEVEGQLEIESSTFLSFPLSFVPATYNTLQSPLFSHHGSRSTLLVSGLHWSPELALLSYGDEPVLAVD